MKEHPTVLDHVALVSQREINAYPVEGVPDMGWEEGDLAVHLAGCWVTNVCNDQWKEYMARRRRVTDALKAKFASSAAKTTTTTTNKNTDADPKGA